MKDLFIQIQALSNSELNWRISDLDFIPTDKGDFIDGIPSDEMKKIYYFQKKVGQWFTLTLAKSVVQVRIPACTTVYTDPVGYQGGYI